MKEWKQLDNTNFWISEYGDLFNIKTNREVKPTKTKKGYLLFRMPGTKLSVSSSIHRIVALFWIGNPPDKSYQVNHKDGNKAE